MYNRRHRGRQDVDYRKFFNRARFASRLEQAMQKELKQSKSDEKAAKQKLDRELDRELEATFPASDALKITLTDSLTRFSRQTRKM
jgi:hypothetical protein